jgi:hypothetical protein
LVIAGLNDNQLPNADCQMPITVLIAHRPELFNDYLNAQNPPCIVFAGHAHGGLVRIFNKGVYSRSEGLFPKYTSGLYKLNQSYMVVSRGLGDGDKFQPRIFNGYHLPVVTITF